MADTSLHYLTTAFQLQRLCSLKLDLKITTGKYTGAWELYVILFKDEQESKRAIQQYKINSVETEEDSNKLKYKVPRLEAGMPQTTI
jgi:hypothetical protein